jgi:1-acyl-sn-glycerol-3-phosphate acyltransferase
VRGRARDRLEAGIAAVLPWLIRRSLRRGLRGVWADGPFDAVGPGTMLAANHHAWWDAYLVWLLARRLRLPLAALMDDAQLRRFPFFARHGVVPRSRPRELARRLEAGALGVVFPEGRLRPPGPPGELAPGAARLARLAGAELRPLAIRVALRGAQHPEASLVLGRPVEGGAALTDALREEVAALDRRLAAAEAEEIPTGFALWLRGASSTDRRAGAFEAWWR